jgi:hypothetical protein
MILRVLCCNVAMLLETTGCFNGRVTRQEDAATYRFASFHPLAVMSPSVALCGTWPRAESLALTADSMAGSPSDCP